jgi:transposase-like protein
MDKEFNNLIELTIYFNNENKCKQYLEKLIWNNTPTCPHCNNNEKIYKYKDNKTYKCSKCLRTFNIFIGTIFENTKISIQKWLISIYLVSSTKKGISSYQLAKSIGITQKSAWFLLQRIRKLLDEKVNIMSNIIEVDETYVGGKNKNRHFNKRIKNTQGRSAKDKIKVFGILERNGRVKSMSISDVSKNIIQPIIYSIAKKGSTIISDEWRAYNGLNKDYIHKRVNHSKYQYVNKDAYTNSLENYWSLVKRNILGIYHNISRKHINRYLNEFDFRYNNRKSNEIIRFNIAVTNCKSRLKYKDLIKQIV